MATTVLDQLKEAESQLKSEIETLNEQLAEAEKQRQGLQTVIDMFGSGGSENGLGASVSEILTSKVSVPAEAEEPEAPEEEEEAPAPKAEPVAKRRGRKASAKTSTAKAAAKAPRKARGGKSPNWQRYVQEPFRKTPLPDVVANILKAQPDEAFKIADVMEAIFKSDMPKATFLKARNRVSNILSAGARTSEWHRGRGGRYSMSAKALK